MDSALNVYSQVVSEHRQALLESALLIAERLRLLELLAVPSDALDVAAQLGLRPHRLRALLDVLTLEGFLDRTQTDQHTCYVHTGRAPNANAVTAQWWEAVVESFIHDRPVESAQSDDTAAAQRFCGHLGRIGQSTATALWRKLGRTKHLLDIGGGDGVYTETFLLGCSESRVTLVEKPPVIPVAKNRLAARRQHVEFVAADARDAVFEPVHDTVLLANLLHLYGPTEAALLVENAAAGLAPNGLMVVVEVEIDEDRSGPPTGVYFSFNMAVYTDGGRVHTPTSISEWLRAVGLKRVGVRVLDDHDETIVITGRK